MNNFSTPLYSNRMSTRSTLQHPLTTFDQMALDTAVAQQRKADCLNAALAVQVAHDAVVKDPLSLVNQILLAGSPMIAQASSTATSSLTPLRRDLGSMLREQDDIKMATALASPALSALLPSSGSSGTITPCDNIVSLSSSSATTVPSLASISTQSEDSLLRLSLRLQKYTTEFNGYNTALDILLERPLDADLTTEVRAQEISRLETLIAMALRLADRSEAGLRLARATIISAPTVLSPSTIASPPPTVIVMGDKHHDSHRLPVPDELILYIPYNPRIDPVHALEKLETICRSIDTRYHYLDEAKRAKELPDVLLQCLALPQDSELIRLSRELKWVSYKSYVFDEFRCTDGFTALADAHDNLEFWPQFEQPLDYAQRAIAAVGQKFSQSGNFDLGTFDLQSRHFAVALMKTFPAPLRTQIERVFQRERESKLLLSRQFNDFGFFLTFDLIFTYTQLVMSDTTQRHQYARHRSELNPPRPFEEIRYHNPLAIFRLGVGKGSVTKSYTPTLPTNAVTAAAPSAAASTTTPAADTSVTGEGRKAKRNRERRERREAAGATPASSSTPTPHSATAAVSAPSTSASGNGNTSRPRFDHTSHPCFTEAGFRLGDSCFKCCNRPDFVPHTNGKCAGQISFRGSKPCYYHALPGCRNPDGCSGTSNSLCPLQQKYGWYDPWANRSILIGLGPRPPHHRLAHSSRSRSRPHYRPRTVGVRRPARRYRASRRPQAPN